MPTACLTTNGTNHTNSGLVQSRRAGEKIINNQSSIINPKAADARRGTPIRKTTPVSATGPAGLRSRFTLPELYPAEDDE